MPCYRPVTAWRSKSGPRPDGTWPVVFRQKSARPGTELKLPCGQCIGCRLERSRQWAIRCVHESKMHNVNCFITLTYEENVFTLNKRDIILFFKKLRKKIYPIKISYYQAGEYGEENERPHHHAAVFGYDFPDKKLWSIRESIKLYRSEMLERIWENGYATIGEITWESAAYIARYCTKKITGAMAQGYYKGRIPEYATMSRRPAIAKSWYEKFKTDVYPGDSIIMRGGIKMLPARYYDKMYDLDDHLSMEKLKKNREERAVNNINNSQERLTIREQIKEEKFKTLKRRYESC